MARQTLGNYLAMHRKRSGFTKQELSWLLGIKEAEQISLHERADVVPTMRVALAYEVLFNASIAGMFPDLHKSIVQAVESRLAFVQRQLEKKSAKGREARRTAQKLEWICERNNARQNAGE